MADAIEGAIGDIVEGLLVELVTGSIEGSSES